MRSDGVVVLSPLLDDDLGFLEAVEDLTVQQLVAQLSVKGFVVAILPGTSRLDVQGFGPYLRQPVAHDLGGHLRTVV